MMFSVRPLMAIPNIVLDIWRKNRRLRFPSFSVDIRSLPREGACDLRPDDRDCLGEVILKPYPRASGS